MLVESSGTQLASVGNEHTLSAPTTPHIRVLLVDAAALLSGETLELRFKTKVLSGGTERLIRKESFPGPLTDPHIQSPPFVMPQGGTITLEQVGGVGRSFPWAIVTLD